MRHQNPTGDLGLLMDRAVDLLIAELEKTRLGKATRPPTTPRKSTRRGYVTRAVRREVFERDGEQCTFVDEAGHRCEERGFLQLDHQRARALGGSDDAPNLAVRCRRHNGLAAERDFGRPYIQKKRHERMRSPLQRGSEPALRALTGMGFKENEAKRALQTVAERTDTELPMTTLLREAIAILT